VNDDLESRLRTALRAVAPSEQLSARLARTPLATSRRGRIPSSGRWWFAAGLAASLLIAFGVQQHVHREQEREQGLEARRQVIEALRVTSEKLDLAYEAARQEGV
jgi:hypothetical protein